MASLLYAKRVKAVIHGVNKKVLVTRQYLEQLEDDLKRRITNHAEINGDGYLREVPVETQLDGGGSREKKTTVPSREQTTEEPSLDDDPEPELDDGGKSTNRTTKCPECGGHLKLKDLMKCPHCGQCMVCKEEPCECECPVCKKVDCECEGPCEVCNENPCECEEPEL